MEVDRSYCNFDDVKERLQEISEELADGGIALLRRDVRRNEQPGAVYDGRPGRGEECERQVMRARRAVNKAIAILDSLSGSAPGEGYEDEDGGR